MITGLLLAHSDWNLKLSGVAKVTEENGNVFFSASLIPPVPDPLPAKTYTARFQSAAVEGFRFRKVQSIEFDSDLSLPKPNWRVQVLYHPTTQ